MDDAQSNISRRGLVAAEQAGRGGDRVLGHLTPGELVVPKSCQTPELMALFAKVAHGAGLDPNRFIVGSPEASKNPRTGLEEFDDGDGDSDGGPGGSTGGANGGVSSDNSAPGGARDTPGTGDPDNSNTESGYGTNGYGPGSSGTLGYGETVDGLANLAEQAIDSGRVSGRSLGVLGWGLGMVPGVGLAMAATKGLQALTGEQGVADYGNDGLGGSSSQPDTRSFVPEIRKRRGLLTRMS
ncbi:hypothetical protein ACHMW5_02275 [Azospirillum melinis]|uniref:hypothetical protein n=1 Tax=Azospirillum melinis TaxID=328839 RepID=UPI003756DCD5